MIYLALRVLRVFHRVAPVKLCCREFLCVFFLDPLLVCSLVCMLSKWFGELRCPFREEWELVCHQRQFLLFLLSLWSVASVLVDGNLKGDGSHRSSSSVSPPEGEAEGEKARQALM